MKDIDAIVRQRHEILRLLYRERLEEKTVKKAFVPENEIRNALGDCDFNLGVLEECGHILRNGGKSRITGEGVAVFEAHETI